MANKVELEDVQGIIIKGYGKMPHAAYLLLHFNEKQKAKSWLTDISEKVTNATLSTKDDAVKHAINIAFTQKGLAILGINDTVMNTFSREFEEGMVTPHRQRVLGDFGESDPKHWDWGNESDKQAVDAVSAENEYDVVFNAQSVVYVKPENDITEKVAERVSKIK